MKLILFKLFASVISIISMHKSNKFLIVLTLFIYSLLPFSTRVKSLIISIHNLQKSVFTINILSTSVSQ